MEISSSTIMSEVRAVCHLSHNGAKDEATKLELFDANDDWAAGYNADGAAMTPPHVAFSASAGAYTYQMGVAAYLQDHFCLNDVVFSGCSGGAWSASLLATNTNVRSAFEHMIEVSEDLYSHRWLGAYFRYDKSILQTCERIWSQDESIHLRCRDRLTISMTKFPTMESTTHSSWESNMDLAHSVVASSTIPFVLTGKAYTAHRGEKYVDGGFTNFSGLNVDSKYCTVKDLVFHAKECIHSAIDYTNTSLIAPYFPSLAKSVSQKAHNFLISGAQSEEPSHPPFTAQKLNQLVITPWKWRGHNPISYHLSCNIDRNRKQFTQGFTDAEMNHAEIAHMLEKED